MLPCILQDGSHESKIEYTVNTDRGTVESPVNKTNRPGAFLQIFTDAQNTPFCVISRSLMTVKNTSITPRDLASDPSAHLFEQAIFI